MSFRKEKRLESFIYLALWSMLFIAPVISLYIRTTSNSDITFDWNEVLMVWKQYALYFAIFLLHNHLLAPQLVYRQRKKFYFSIVGALIIGFAALQCSSRPVPRPERMHPGHMPHELAEKAPRHDPLHMNLDEPMHPRHEHPDEAFRSDDQRPPEAFPKGDRMHPIFLDEHNIVALVILILMLGANLGIKLYFKQRADQKKLADMEKQNLEQQLEYLKYQINPHFLMNTLNNIHALVDIEPEQAKETIVELSKMLRFVLYEGNKPTVPLTRELDFLNHYITLMRLRYTEKVHIAVKMPEQAPSCEIPPLIFITFVENAFKHGVSYQQESFIDVELRTENSDKLIFICRNSKLPSEEDKHGGVGLKNVKQRLDLIYGKNYTLNINDEPQEYNIQLVLPL